MGSLEEYHGYPSNYSSFARENGDGFGIHHFQSKPISPFWCLKIPEGLELHEEDIQKEFFCWNSDGFRPIEIPSVADGPRPSLRDLLPELHQHPQRSASLGFCQQAFRILSP